MRSFLYVVSGIFGFFGFNLLGSNLQERLSVGLGIMIVLIPATFIGWLIAKFCKGKIDPDGDRAHIFAWTNLVFWIFPAFGFVAAQFTYGLADETEDHAVEYLLLSSFGVLASVVNCALGVMAVQSALHATAG